MIPPTLMAFAILRDLMLRALTIAKSAVANPVAMAEQNPSVAVMLLPDADTAALPLPVS